jgi:hypothetical protein
MTQTTQDMLLAAQQRAEQAAQQWLAEHSAPGQIEQAVRARLDARLDVIVQKLLGFDCSSWGKDWELDHCNGRSGDSAAGDWLRKRVAAEAKEWLNEQAGNLPKLPASAIKSLRNEYVDDLKRAINTLLEKKAMEAARNAVHSIIDAK